MRAGALLLLAGAVACAGEGETPPRPECAPVLEERPAPRWVELGGGEPFAVFVAGASRPVEGRRSVVDGRQRFRPAFPFAPGVAYELRRDGCRASVRVPSLEAAAPRVTAVYPRSATIPENVLRFYITFSAAMEDGAALEHVRLTAADGEDLSGAFFVPDDELWSADRRRLTLLVDPGRVKTGLRAHRELGRAFRATERYTLRVEPGWRSLAGSALEEPFEHRFVAGPEDRERVDPERWRVSLAEDEASLTVDFGEPVDHRSVERLLRVVSPANRIVLGRWVLAEGDARATWWPEDGWAGGADQHRVVVDRRFEDIAGNDVRAAFDHRVGDAARDSSLVELRLDDR